MAKRGFSACQTDVKGVIMDKVPLLKGFIVKAAAGHALIRVWCPFCKCVHTHGWPADNDNRSGNWLGSHRVAHCHVKSSPFKRGGYYVKPFTKKEMIAFGVSHV